MRVNLNEVCTKEEWWLAGIERKLQSFGLSRRDATDFAGFMFADRATLDGGVTDGEPEGWLWEEQVNRLFRLSPENAWMLDTTEAEDRTAAERASSPTWRIFGH